MNMELMATETKKLKEVKPTKFVRAYCFFWIDCFYIFKRHLPKKHKKLEDDAISIEAVEAFKKCFSYPIKVKTYENEKGN